MGLPGYFISNRSIFFFVVIRTFPTLFTVLLIRPDEIDYELTRGAKKGADDGKPAKPRALLKDRPFLIFLACAVIFHFANAAMLPHFPKSGAAADTAVGFSYIVPTNTSSPAARRIKLSQWLNDGGALLGQFPIRTGESPHMPTAAFPDSFRMSPRLFLLPAIENVSISPIISLRAKIMSIATLSHSSQSATDLLAESGSIQEILEFLPPGLRRQLGYFGGASCISFYHDLRARDVVWNDGRRSGIGGGAWQAFVKTIEPLAKKYRVDLFGHGSAPQALVVDQCTYSAYFADMDEAKRMVKAQYR